jgi:hypothetical protein
VTIKSENQSLKLILDLVFQGTLVKYYEIETQILLKRESELEVKLASGDSSNAPIYSQVLKTHFANARYSVLEKGKYKLHFSLENLFSIRFNTVRRRGFGSQMPLYQKETVDSLDILLKDTTLEKKERRRIIKHRRIVRDLVKPFFRFALGGFVAPEITYRSLKGEKPNEVSERNLFEDWRWNYSAGMTMDYFFTKHWFFRSGLSYLNFGETGRYQADKPYILPSETSNTDTVISYRNNLSLFGIPICLGFKTSGRISFAFNTGIIIGLFPQQYTSYPEEKSETYTYTNEYVVNPNFQAPPNRPNPFDKAPGQNPFFQQRPYQRPPFSGPGPFPPQVITQVYYITTTAFYYRDYLDPRKHSLRQVNYIYSFTFDIGYELSSKWRLALSPSFKYFLTSKYTSGDEMKEKPYSLGVSVGVSYFFRNHK